MIDLENTTAEEFNLATENFSRTKYSGERSSVFYDQSENFYYKIDWFYGNEKNLYYKENLQNFFRGNTNEILGLKHAGLLGFSSPKNFSNKLLQYQNNNPDGCNYHSYFQHAAFLATEEVSGTVLLDVIDDMTIDESVKAKVKEQAGLSALVLTSVFHDTDMNKRNVLVDMTDNKFSVSHIDFRHSFISQDCERYYTVPWSRGTSLETTQLVHGSDRSKVIEHLQKHQNIMHSNKKYLEKFYFEKFDARFNETKNFAKSTNLLSGPAI